METPTGLDPDLHCSFCGKGSDDVAKMIASTSFAWSGVRVDANICDECTSLHVEVIASDNRAWLEAQLERWRGSRIADAFAAAAAEESKET